MSPKTLGPILIVAGIIVGVLSVLADIIRVGMLPGTFGAVQIVGTIVGVGLIVAGIVILVRPKPE